MLTAADELWLCRKMKIYVTRIRCKMSPSWRSTAGRPEKFATIWDEKLDRWTPKMFTTLHEFFNYSNWFSFWFNTTRGLHLAATWSSAKKPFCGNFRNCSHQEIVNYANWLNRSLNISIAKNKNLGSQRASAMVWYSKYWKVDGIGWFLFYVYLMVGFLSNAFRKVFSVLKKKRNQFVVLTR